MGSVCQGRVFPGIKLALGPSLHRCTTSIAEPLTAVRATDEPSQYDTAAPNRCHHPGTRPSHPFRLTLACMAGLETGGPGHRPLLLQIGIFGGCVLSLTQFRGEKKSFHEWYLSKLGLSVNPKKLGFFLDWVLPFIFLVVALIWQLVLNSKPLISVG